MSALQKHLSHSTGAAALLQRRDKIVTAWLNVLSDTHLVIGNESAIRANLEKLIDCLISMLFTPSGHEVAAREIGVALIDLGFDSPENLRQTIALLGQEVVDVFSPSQLPAFLPRLLIFMGALAEGFTKRMWLKNLDEQDRLHQAFRLTQQHMEIHLQGVLVHTPVILATLDQNGIITYLAGKSLASLDVIPEKLIGKSIHIVAGNIPDILEFVEAALRGESFTALLDIKDKVFETRSIPVRDLSHNIVGVIGIAFDVTTRSQLMAEVAKLNQSGNVVTQLSRVRDLGDTIQDRLTALADQGADLGQTTTVELREIKKLVQQLVTCVRSPAHTTKPVRSTTVSLSPDELMAVRLLAMGKTNRQMSDLLGISEKAVEKRLTKLFAKLEVQSRSEAIAWAIQHRALQ